MTKIIAVICKDLDDFKSWWQKQGFVCAHFCNGELYVGDDIYRGVYKPEHLCSFMIDEIIQTTEAFHNPLYSEIHQQAISNLKEQDQDYVGKPPLGIKPRYLHDEARFTELRDAIKRSMDVHYYVDPEWITEYNELLERIVKKK